MRFSTARGAIVVCLLFGLAGCSSSGGSRSWWMPFSFKSKSTSVPASSLANAPAPPSIGPSGTSAAPTNTVAAAPNYNAQPAVNTTAATSSPYPTTPYASSNATPSPAANQSAYPAATTMPPTTNYGSYMPQNAGYTPAAQSANPYANVVPQAPTYTANQQYSQPSQSPPNGQYNNQSNTVTR